MEFRKATKKDYNEIMIMYRDVVDKMDMDGINIWNDYYPFDEFEDDIKIGRLYIVVDDGTIVAGVALCKDNAISKEFEWKEKDKEALYIERLAVNVNYQKRGVAKNLIDGAVKVAKEKNIDYIRLAVVDINLPAMKMYLKNGFNKVNGVYLDKVNENTILKEYGLEKEIEEK